MGFFIAKVLDRGIIEFIGPFGLSNYLIKTSFNISKLDSGLVTNYALYITLGLLSLVFLVFALILIDTSLFSEIRLLIIYIPALILVLSPNI